MDNIYKYDKYPYNSIVIGVNSVNDLNKLIQFKHKIPISNPFNHGGFLNRTKEDLENGTPLYFKYTIINKENEDGKTVEWGGWDHLEYLETSERNDGRNHEKLFTADDVKNGLFYQILTLSNSNITPSYTPKKIERTFENVTEPKYVEYVYKCVDEKDSIRIQTELMKQGYLWAGRHNHIREFKEYPVLIFADVDCKIITKCHYSDQNINTYVNKDQTVCDIIFDRFTYYKYINIVGKIPSYEPKKIERTFESYLHTNYKYDSVIVAVYSRSELDSIMDLVHKYCDSEHEIRDYKYKLSTKPIYFRFGFDFNNRIIICGGSYLDALEKIQSNMGFKYEKVYNVNDLKNGLLDNIVKDGVAVKSPSYKPRKIIRENMITKLNDYLILEKSSLTALGVPKEVMQGIQKDLAIPVDATWDRIKLKKDVTDIISNEKEFLIIQIGIDSISVFVSYEVNGDRTYFIDTYLMKDEQDWGGGYDKQPRRNLSKSQFITLIEPKMMIYKLNGKFSYRKQGNRRVIKKEKDFEVFTENFKKDFLKNFDAILKRIVGQNYKDAKDEVLVKAKQIEKENRMIISGLDNPLKGPNSLTIMDEFIYQFEEEYSKYFDERLDIQELSELFTREKVMTSFMLYVYSGKIITT